MTNSKSGGNSAWKHFKICNSYPWSQSIEGAIQCLKLKVLALYSQTYADGNESLELHWFTINNCLKAFDKGENSVVREIIFRETKPKYFRKAERFCSILQYFWSTFADYLKTNSWNICHSRSLWNHCVVGNLGLEIKMFLSSALQWLPCFLHC